VLRVFCAFIIVYSLDTCLKPEEINTSKKYILYLLRIINFILRHICINLRKVYLNLIKFHTRELRQTLHTCFNFS
jgi:hypothetical protein